MAERPTVLNADPAEAEHAVSTIVMAFSRDPFVRWMLPEPGRYLAYFPGVVRLFSLPAFENASAYRSEDFMAAAIWHPPGVHPDGDAIGALMATGMTPERLEEAAGVFEQMADFHPQFEHWYLPMIGVDPAQQGKGYGSALLAKSLEACDAAHLPAYLESTNERNVPLYERYGFKVTGTIQANSSPTLWPMLRDPR